MEKENNLYEKIQSLLGNFKGNFNVLEEEINIDTQLEYFESSKTIKKDFNKMETLVLKDDLFSSEVTIAEKKLLLVMLASIDQVEAFRTLEKYQKNPDPVLKDWSTLAMQESKMLLESVFLDQNQIFISTGLGGKGKKLRYFIVFLSKFNLPFDDFQKKIVGNEIDFAFRRTKAEIEKLDFSESFCCVKACIPIELNINNIFAEAIEACNLFGEILEENYIVTNMKELTRQEILDVLMTLKKKTAEPDDSLSESGQNDFF